MFANLEKRRVGCCFNKVACGVDIEQPWAFVADLATKNEAGGEGFAIRREVGFVHRFNGADGIAHHMGRLKHRDTVQQRVAGFWRMKGLF